MSDHVTKATTANVPESPFVNEEEEPEARPQEPVSHGAPIIYRSAFYCPILIAGYRAYLEPAISPEFLKIFQAFETCLGLRDKYMRLSQQRLGDNPRDHDGSFSGLDPNISDVSGVKPDVDHAACEPPESPFKRWRIYPKPPPPHWHWTDRTEPIPGAGQNHGKEEFIFESCDIPGSDPWNFEMDEKGVYQVYDNVQG